jgi:hypothetical protein
MILHSRYYNISQKKMLKIVYFNATMPLSLINNMLIFVKKTSDKCYK